MKSTVEAVRVRTSSLSFRIIGAFVLAIMAVTAGVAWTELRNEAAKREAALVRAESARADVSALAIEQWADEVRRDVAILSETPPISGIIRATGDPGGFDTVGQTDLMTWKRRLQRIFVAFLRAADHYAQIRYIGLADGGRELVRAEYSDGEIVVTEESGLQAKEDRDYFRDGLALQPGQTIFSEITLNRERGTIELPYRPMLRAIRGAFDEDGKLFGLVVINVDARQLLGLLRAGASPDGRVYLTNSRGDFLLHPNAGVAFGFDLGQRHLWQEEFPDVPLRETAAAQTLSPADASADRSDSAQKVGDRILTVRRIGIDPANPERDVFLAFEIGGDDSLAHGPLSASPVTMATVLIAATLSALVLVSFSRMLKPLKQLSHSATEIGAGRLDVTFPETQVKELRDLVDAFRQMTAGIRSRDRALEESNAEIRLLNAELRERLAASDHRAALAIRVAGIGLWDVEPATRRVLWDDRMQDILGLTPSEMPATVADLVNLIHPDDRPDISAQFEAVLVQGTEFAAIFRVAQSGDRYRYLDARAGAVRDSDGALVLMRGVVIDVTIERRTALEYQALNEELSSFAYAVSHDLRAPLRSMNGFAEALKDEYGDTLDETARDYVQRISKSAVRMGVLIDDILTLTRISTTELVRREVDLSQMAAEIVDELRSGEPARNSIVEIAAGLTAVTDPGMARVVLWNLLGNAWKYSREASPAEIGFDLTDRGGRPAFRISDNGMGFDMAYAEKLYQPFQRLHSDRRIEGTGIGLATVSRVIRRLDGTIEAVSEPGKGATFYFTL